MRRGKATKDDILITNIDITAEIASAKTRGEVLTTLEAVERIHQRRQANRDQYGWFRALQIERELREERQGRGRDAR
jgi:hypothetical protein